MEPMEVEALLRKLDRRTYQVEQILPTLPAREEMQEAIEGGVRPLATKQELEAAVAKLATKQELEQAVAKLATREELERAVAKLATKEELERAVARLATKEELERAVAKLATKEELERAVAKLATKEELEELDQAVANLATKQELGSVKEELADLRRDMREEGERTRRHFDVMAERMHDEVRVIAESHVGLLEKVRRERKDVSEILKSHDKRIMRLELSDARRRKQR